MKRSTQKAVEVLTIHEQELRLLMETIPALVWRAAPDGNIEYVNGRVLEYFGVPLDEIIGWRWMERVHPDDVAFKVRTWLENLQSAGSHDVACRFRGADGQYRWFAVRAEPQRARDGGVLSWCGVLIDIDDRWRAERALRDSEYNLRQIIDTVPGLVWSAGPNGEITRINQRILDYSSMRFEDFLHHGWKKFLHPDDVSESANAFYHAIETGTSYQAIHRLRRADGEYRWHHVRGEPLRDPQGRIVQWYGLSVDIDDRKKAEEQLRRSEAHLAEAQRLSHTGASAYNDSTILYWSEETYRIWGFDPAHGIPSREAVFQRVHPDDRDRIRAEVERALREKKGSLSEFRIVLPDGTVKHLESIREPVLSATGEFVEIVGTQIDVTERKRAEQALRDSEYNLRQIIETVPGLLWSAGPDGEITRINQRILDYSGMRFEDFLHHGWKKFLHPDDVSESANAFYHAIETGTSYQAIHRLRRVDGEYRWHHVRGEPLRDPQGRIVQWYGVSVDIDDGKRAEEHLRRSEAYLADAQRLSHTGTWARNQTKTLHWSEENYRIWGLDPRQGLPSRETVFSRVHPDDRNRVFQGVEHALRKKMDYAVEFRIVLPDGTIKHIESISRNIFSPEGELVEVLGTHIDVTERKRTEQALRESEAKFRDYAETASDWFWEIGPDYKFTLLTENAFGSDSEGRIGKAYWDHALDLETEPEKWRVVRATLDSRKPFRDFVYCSVAGDGSPMYVKASGKPVFDANGNFCGYRGTGTDVTANVRAQEEHERLRQLESDLAHMNRLSMMGELTASLAHEITQPIAAACNNTRAAIRFLDRRPPDLSEVREALDCIVADADRAGEIIGRVRDQIKKAPPRKDLFDVNKAINDVIALARSEAGQSGVSIQTRLTEGLSSVRGDCVQLQQVILNLILNAVEAMSAVDGVRELLISSERSQAGGILVAVRDSGPGIHPERLERLFEAFYTTKSSGIGMGLSISRSIIEAHGGHLWASANEPRGAVFQFTLPSAE